MKLPWTAARDGEAQLWAERSFGSAPPACAARVGKILCEQVTPDLEALSPNRALSEHAEFNELRRVELLLALEREFDISIPDSDAETLLTPAAIVAFVSKQE